MLVPTLLALAATAQGDTYQADPLEPRAHDHLTVDLHVLADSHDHASLISIGRSREGRRIEGLRIGTDPDAPAILLVGNLTGPRLFAGEVVFDHGRRLVEGYATEERVRAFLDTTTVYVLPRPNPDATERCIDGWSRDDVRFETTRASGPGVDEDRDGVTGEDGADDVDGDGVIAWMRYPDPEGTWRVDPSDARAMVEADRDAGERGVWKVIVEGRDADGDGEVGEDPWFGGAVSRNFQAGWQQYEPAAGVFPTDEPATLALTDFLVVHPELALVVTYDELDNLVEKPKTVADDAPSVKRVPPSGVRASDGALLAELGERYREITGADATSATDDDAGTFQRFAYEHRGLLTLNAVLWDMPEVDPPTPDEDPDGEGDGEESGEESGEEAPKPTQDAKRLAWIDEQGEPESWRFLPWRAFDHPELGPVEIGGFAPFAHLMPPASEGAQIAEKHFEHFLTLGALLPRIRIGECTMEAIGGGVWKVRAVLENDAYLPVFTRAGLRTRSTRPPRMELVLPDGAELLAGSRRELVSRLDGVGGRHEAEWLVQGPEGMEVGVRVDSDHVGDDARTAEVIR